MNPRKPAIKGPASTVLTLPILRPVAVSMLFLALSLLGVFAWRQIPVELLPMLSGERLHVQIYRPGARPEVLEEDILRPLENQIATLAGVTETSAEIVGDKTRLTVEFEPGVDRRVRGLELRQIAAQIVREQPAGTVIRVAEQDSSRISRFVMSVQVLGQGDVDTLRDFVDEQIRPQLESVPGVSQILVLGGAGREVAIRVDANRCAQLGIEVDRIAAVLEQAMPGSRRLGDLAGDAERLSLVLDGTPEAVTALGEIQLLPDRPVLLRHVADIELAPAPRDSVSRVNGKPAVTLVVFQEQGANLLQLGVHLQDLVQGMQVRYRPLGLEFYRSFDASEVIDEQLSQLKQLALSGFAIALVVLFLFLRSMRAIAVVSVAVPTSLLIAGALLYLGGYSLNLITLFGLVIGIGMLVDNSIVVFEAVQRQRERGADIAAASATGITRSLRAIVTASATNAIVFVPLLYIDAVPHSVRQVLNNIVPAIVFPLAASLLVATGLVPMLARHFAIGRQAGSSTGGNAARRARELILALLKVSLRRPSPWALGLALVLGLTLVLAAPWVLVQSISQTPGDSEQFRMEVTFNRLGSLEAAGLVFEHLESAALSTEAVERVESSFRFDQGTLTLHLLEDTQRPAGVDAASVRRALYRAARDLGNVRLSLLNSAGNGDDTATGVLGEEKSYIALSGPDSGLLSQMAEDVAARLAALPMVESAEVDRATGTRQLSIALDYQSLAAHRLTVADTIDALSLLGREGQPLSLGFPLPSGRELPITLRRELPDDTHLNARIERLFAFTDRGTISLDEVVSTEKQAAPAAIRRENGRREMRVDFSLRDDAPRTGPGRTRLEADIDRVIAQTYIPDGYRVMNTGGGETKSWFMLLALPILLLLFAVLAISFESFTLPALILAAVPLTLFGAVWALFLTNMGFALTAVVGLVVLLGLTVNPAVLLVDRMQHYVFATKRANPGAAAMLAVRERVRPVLMTAATTIAGLWPLALSDGGELDIWPPFATVVIGGLVASTLLTLLVIPMGFVALARVDHRIRRSRGWTLLIPAMAIVVGVAWVWQLMPMVYPDAATAASFFASLALVLAIAWLWWRATAVPQEMDLASRPLSLEVKYLSKCYGAPGQLLCAWRNPHTPEVEDRRLGTLTYLLLGAACIYIAIGAQYLIWLLVFAYLAQFFARQGWIYWSAGREDNTAQRVKRLLPWLTLLSLGVPLTLWPLLQEETLRLPLPVLILLAAVTLFIQRGLAPVQTVGEIRGWRRWRASWHRFCRRLLSPGQALDQHRALQGLNFLANPGMIGVLGPNGAGKTTLLRILAGILAPSTGTVHYAGVEGRKVTRQKAGLIGFLPQEFGLPGHMSGWEYLEYYALLYGLEDAEGRRQRLRQLLEDVGLLDKAGANIGSYSGGMRQRLAIARTLIHNPSIIIVDEPTVGLDPRERIRLRNLLAKLATGRIVLFSTHVIEDVAVSCDRVLVIQRGQLVYDGNTERLSRLAQGRVWQLAVQPEQVSDIEQRFKVVQQTVDGSGGVILKILSPTSPGDDAVAIDAGLEEGYLQLLYGEAGQAEPAMTIATEAHESREPV
ncbi:efflux RND transporter permease subunit [Microbulbifer sp. TYP-18]|uniref:efflux RND transporter permease subunit n=1 Tax=Microbulbifer sp. TYP-18 TaxID=3230024 RepID=UPI0034C62741